MSETLSSTRLREALEKTICHACGNPIGWNGVHDEANKRLWRSDWRECSFCKRARAALSLPEREPRDGYTLVPDSALRWLFGEEGDFAPPTEYGQAHAYKRPYWWRSEFRKRIEAAQTVQPAPAGAGEGLREYVEWMAAQRCDKSSMYSSTLCGDCTTCRARSALRSASPVGAPDWCSCEKPLICNCGRGEPHCEDCAKPMSGATVSEIIYRAGASPVHDCALEVYKRTLKGAAPVAPKCDVDNCSNEARHELLLSDYSMSVCDAHKVEAETRTGVFSRERRDQGTGRT